MKRWREIQDYNRPEGLIPVRKKMRLKDVIFLWAGISKERTSLLYFTLFWSLLGFGPGCIFDSVYVNWVEKVIHDVHL
jgi:hypothetical protein